MHTCHRHTPYARLIPPQSRTAPPPPCAQITNGSGRNFILLFIKIGVQAFWDEREDQNGAGVIRSPYGGQMNCTGTITLDGKPPQVCWFVVLDGAGKFSVTELAYSPYLDEEAFAGHLIGCKMLACHALGANPTLWGEGFPAWLREAVGPLSPEQAELRDSVVGAWASVLPEAPNPSLSLQHRGPLCGTIVLALVPGWTCSKDALHR